MAQDSRDPLRDAAPDFDDLEARRARAGVAAALFSADSAGAEDEDGEPITVGRYRVSSRLGAGGMGVVYRAYDPDLDRPVAVKLLHADAADDETARARMLREARALAKLNHPNVIAVYDVGVEDGQVFVAMELVKGRELREWIDARRPAQWREVLEVFLAAGRGLEAAHAVGLVHRDFKPENVLVGDDGRVRVLDFGLARARTTVGGASEVGEGRPGPDAAATGEGTIEHLPTSELAGQADWSGALASGRLTETGALVGTPLYMAPELYAGEAADAASDQFAFCASLYEGIYRARPFGAQVLSEHVEAVRGGHVAPPPEDTPAPPKLGELIARGLAPAPEARHRDMSSLLTELEGLLDTPAPTELPEAGGNGRWLMIGAAVLLAVVGLVAAELGLFGGGQPETPPTQPGLDAPPAASVEEPDAGRAEAGPVSAESGTDTGSETGAGPQEAIAPGTAGTGEAGTAGSEGGTGEQETEAKAANPEPEGHGWCHLHEDHFTLLARTKRRRSSLSHQGSCYQCRVERRRSRTRNFSPRDCLGYSLCFPTRAEDCR